MNISKSELLRKHSKLSGLRPEFVEALTSGAAAIEEQGLIQNCGGCQYEDKTNADLPCRNCLRSGTKPDLYTK